MKKVGLFSLLTLLISTAAHAAPIYAIGTECPTDAQMAANPAYTRQYYVTQALACVYDPATNNIQGNQAEANLYLNVLGGGWVGLGESPVGFSFTTDAGNDDGTFTFGIPLTGTYNQFALAIKDGSMPFWAIFALASGTTSGNWGFSTEQGDLSHFAVFAHTGNVVINPLCPLPPCNDTTPVPEPASLFLVGTGIILSVRRFRRK